jgi:LacI family transcriptional regulator
MTTQDGFEPRPTLRTLAEITGLGVSTVSQALRDSPEIAEETKRRVRLAAQQAGYRPNRAGVRLRTGKTNVISLVLNSAEDGSGLVSNMVYGISDALADTSYHLVITPYSLSDPMQPIRYIVDTASADGVIISRTQPNDPRVRFMTDHGMPFVTHGRTEMDIVHPFFDYDNEAFARAALQILKNKGRKRIALLGPPAGFTFHKHTHAGFEAGLNHLNLNGVPLATVDIDTPLIDIQSVGRELALRQDRPDGFVCSSVAPSIALASGLKDEGLAIGKDYDIVTKHSTELLALTLPEVIAMQEDFREAGFEMARMLIARINGSDAAGLQKLVGPAS